MNRRMIIYMVGQMLKLESILLLLPLIVSIIYRESCYSSFLITIAIAMSLGFLLTCFFKPKNKMIFAKEGFITVALAWIVMSLIGALPFYLSREIPSYINAFFETVSGFTTTGASILTNVEGLSKGLLFWRSFTHWIGGMGVLVFVMAIIPSVSDSSIHMLRAEMPGPIVGKLVPRAKKTAKILYLIYIALTLVQIIFLVCGDMSLYESIVHAFGTAGTGGYSIKNSSIAAYSAYSQWIITIFMFLFSINFNLFYLILIKHIKTVIKSTELWVFVSICIIATSIITLNIMPLYQSFSESLKNSAFQVSSIISTTGYSTADFNSWPSLSKGILLVLMFTGGCAGSTCGGLKISRIVLMFKMIRNEFLRMIHPHSVSTVKFEGKRIDEKTLNGVSLYFSLYMVIFFAIFIVLCFEPFSFETNFSAVAACYNNIGPGFGIVGPIGSYADYSVISKIVLSFAMLLGRLEIYPILISLNFRTWIKK